MKKFIRSMGGKIFIFIMCAVSLIAFIASSVGILAMIEEDIYIRSRESIRDSYIRSIVLNNAYSWGYEAVESVKLSEEDDGISFWGQNDNYIYELYDEEGKLIIDTDAPDGFDGRYIGAVDYYYSDSKYEIKAYFDDSAPLTGDLKTAIDFIEFAYCLRYAAILICIGSFLIALLSYICLMCASGRRPGSEDIHPGYLNKVPFDLLLGFCAIPVSVVSYMAGELFNASVAISIMVGMIVIILLSVVFLGLSMSIAARVKQHNLIKNTVIAMGLRLIWRVVKAVHGFNMNILRNLKFVPKTIILIVIFALTEIILIPADESDRFMFEFFRGIIIAVSVLYVAVSAHKLFAQGERMARGNLNQQTDTSKWRFLPLLRRHGENLNSIELGINAAVENRLKSERMKTELITNVSHDIKTPLTSIINYADLIASSDLEDAALKEYSEVLVRQSDRLKRLLEDLVEVSKASTGNLEVNLEACKPSVFIAQAAGEYEEKLKKSGLTLVTRIEDDDLIIMADGRRMWRIFDNLMNNICKYALPKTRVYLTLSKEDGYVRFDFKNTSNEALDISEEELMERFVRGDRSRSSETEGNGLGLSIARSLAELQRGSLMIDIDGDLFKAVLRFPIVNIN